MSFERLSTGAIGEDLATAFLRRAGYKILDRNIKNFFGEIDILSEHKRAIVLVEVKTKRGRAYGTPQEMVHRHKQHKLRQLALWLSQQYPNRIIRVDVIAVDLADPGKPILEHLKNVIEGIV